MRRLAIILSFILTLPALAQRYPQKQVQFVDEFGQGVNLTTNVSIYVYSTGTTTEIPLYLDAAGQRAVTQPITDTSTNTCLNYTNGTMTFFTRYAGFQIVATDGTYTRTIDNLSGSRIQVYWPTYMVEIGDILDALEGVTAFGTSLIDDANSTEARATLGLVIGTDVQAYDANLLELAALNPTTGQYFYHDGNEWQLGTSTDLGRTMLGTSTLTDGGILLGSGTGAFTALGVATNGQIPIGDGTTDPVLATITAVANETDVTNGAGTITIGIVDPLIVAKGGSGAATLTDGGILLGSGTGAITPMSVLADGEFIVGDGTTDPVAESGETALASLGVDANWIPMVNHTESDAERRTWKGDVHLDHVYDVRDYGILVSDGATDCYAAFNAAEAAADDAGGVVWVPDGNYAVDWNFPVSPNVVFYFEPNAVITIPTGHYIEFGSPDSVQGAIKPHFNCQGTATVQWTIPGKVYAEWWGATPTNATDTPTHDDGPAITAAIASFKQTGPLHQTGSGVLQLLTGSYGIATPIVMTSGHRGTIIRGHGSFDNGTVLQSLMTAGEDIFTITGTTASTGGETGVYGCTTRDFCVSGTGSKTEGDGLDIRGYFDGTIENIHVRQVGKNGFYIDTSYVTSMKDIWSYDNGKDGVHLVGNVGNCWTGGDIGQNDGNGVYATSLNMVQVTVEYNAGADVNLVGSSASILATNCYFESADLHIGDDVNLVTMANFINSAFGASTQVTLNGPIQNSLFQGCVFNTVMPLLIAEPNQVRGQFVNCYQSILPTQYYTVGEVPWGAGVAGIPTLIENGSFGQYTSTTGENPGPCTGWYFQDPAAASGVFTIVSDGPRGTGFCVDVNCDSYTSGDGVNVSLATSYSAEVGKTYTFSYWLKTTSEDTYVAIYHSGQWHTNQTYAQPSTGDEWTHRWIQMQPTIAGNMNVNIGIAASGTFRLADAMLVEGPEIPTYPQIYIRDSLQVNGDVNVGGIEVDNSTLASTVLNFTVTLDPNDLDPNELSIHTIPATGAALGDFVLVSAPYDLEYVVPSAYVESSNVIRLVLRGSSGTATLASGAWKFRVVR